MIQNSDSINSIKCLSQKLLRWLAFKLNDSQICENLAFEFMQWSKHDGTPQHPGIAANFCIRKHVDAPFF